MQVKKSKEDELKEIILSDDSNIILPEVSFPSSYTNAQPVKYGAKSTEGYKVNQHQLLDYQRRISRSDYTLTSEEIRNLVTETNERRRSLEQSINEQKQAFQQKRAAELAARHAKEREEQRAHRIANESDLQREKRLAQEQEVKTSRAKELQALENKREREKEDVIVFFELSSNRFSQKYGNATKKIAGDVGVDRIISSRVFTTNRFAHRCVPCGYHQPESLSISKMYLHLFEQKDQHLQFTLNEIDRYYNTQKVEIRHKHAEEDNPDLRQQKLAKDIESLNKLKGVNYR